MVFAVNTVRRTITINSETDYSINFLRGVWLHQDQKVSYAQALNLLLDLGINSLRIPSKLSTEQKERLFKFIEDNLTLNHRRSTKTRAWLERWVLAELKKNN